MATVLQGDLKSCQRMTLSLPKNLVGELKRAVPKSKRSAFVAAAVERELLQQKLTNEEDGRFWESFWKRNLVKSKLSAVEIVKKDRGSH